MSPPASGAAFSLPYRRDLFLLRPDVTFLNHGSFGACPRPVFETYQALQRELEGEPVAFLGRGLPEMLAEARKALAAYLGTEPDNLVFVPNATFGVNAVAHSLAPMLQPGDQVLSTDHEYGATERAWRFVCGRRGASYVRRPLPLPVTDPQEWVEALWAGVTPRTRILFLSHITSPTAVILPVAEIARRAREAGILTVVDGAHAPGQLRLALDDLGVDFYTGNCHKWLCSPKGAAFLYVRPEHQPRMLPLVVSWGWESERPGPSPFQDLFAWLGTDDPSAYLSVPAAIAFQEVHGWDRVRAACHELGVDLRQRLHALTGLPPLCPEGTEWWVQMFAVPLPVPPQQAGALQQALWEQFRIEVPVLAWNGHTLLRVSLQAYNSPEDGERLLPALSHLLA